MTLSTRRTVLGSVLTSESSEVVENQVGEVAGLIEPESTTSSHARILAWIERDSRRVPTRERRRVFELQATDGRSLVCVDEDW